jgi:hypothetical protein
MTEKMKGSQLEREELTQLEGVTVNDLLQLNGVYIEKCYTSGGLSVRKVDDTTIMVDNFELEIDPETGSIFYKKDDFDEEEAENSLIENICNAVELLKRGLNPDLMDHWNDEIYNRMGSVARSEYDWKNYDETIADTFDRLQKWLREQVTIAMNETNFGVWNSDTIKISFNDRDVSSRTVGQLIKCSKK